MASIVTNLSTAQIAALSTTSISNLSTFDISSLSSAQVVALTTAQFSVLNSAQVSAFTTSQISAIQTDDVSALQSSAITGLRTAQLGALSSDQIKSLTATQTPVLSSGQLGAISVTGLAGLETADLAALSTAAIGGLKTAQMAALSSNQLVALSTAQAFVLSSAQVAAIATANISAVETADLSALKTAAIVGLTTAQIGELSTDQVVALSTAQFAALKTGQIAALSTAQVAAIETRDLVSLGTAAFSTLSSNQIGALSTNQVGGLGTTQMAALTSVQIVGLSTNAVDILTTQQLAALSMASVSALMGDADLVAAMDADQIGAVLAVQTPLVLDLNGDGVRTRSISQGVRFDLNADGVNERSGWVSPEDGFLALDRNQDGLISDGSELFGSATVLGSGANARDGFEALRELDSNSDGVVDANDSRFADLRVWVDGNQNGVTGDGELRTLESLGITRIDVNARNTSRMDEGNWVGLESSYTSATGSPSAIADVWLQVDSSPVQPVGTNAKNVTVSAGEDLRSSVIGLVSAMAAYQGEAGVIGSPEGGILTTPETSTSMASVVAIGGLVDSLKQFDANGQSVVFGSGGIATTTQVALTVGDTQKVETNGILVSPR